MDWQQIDTAPEYTLVLLWIPWKGAPSTYAPKGFMYIARWTEISNSAEGWVDDDGDPVGDGATHWMPLPAPPVETGD